MSKIQILEQSADRGATPSVPTASLLDHEELLQMPSKDARCTKYNSHQGA